MKKSPLVKLVLITSALASCDSTRHITDQNTNSPDSPDRYYAYHDTTAAERESTVIYPTDTTYHYAIPDLHVDIPHNFVHPTLIYHTHDISRGGFGHYGGRMSVSS